MQLGNPDQVADCPRSRAASHPDEHMSKRKSDVTPMRVRRIVAANLQSLMAGHINLNTVMKVEAATKAAGCQIGHSSVSRMLQGEASASLEWIDVLASVYGLEPWQLLVPGLTYRNPPTLSDRSDIEQETYETVMKFANLIKGLKPEDKP